jgi:broad specificity phosphatase PhoE
MLNIILARHGQPDFDYGVRLASRDMPACIERFNQAQVLLEGVPGAARELAASSAVLLSSTLRRSMLSAQHLAGDRNVIAEALFREADLPYANWAWPRLSFSAWTVLFRVGWYCGFSAHGESYAAAKSRARRAAQRLIGLARDTGPVFLVGHGIMNRLIARELLACGALGPKHPDSGWWRPSVYQVSAAAGQA